VIAGQSNSGPLSSIKMASPSYGKILLSVMTSP
jgi:hypothetical protein